MNSPAASLLLAFHDLFSKKIFFLVFILFVLGILMGGLFFWGIWDVFVGSLNSFVSWVFGYFNSLAPDVNSYKELGTFALLLVAVPLLILVVFPFALLLVFILASFFISPFVQNLLKKQYKEIVFKESGWVDTKSFGFLMRSFLIYFFFQVFILFLFWIPLLPLVLSFLNLMWLNQRVLLVDTLSGWVPLDDILNCHKNHQKEFWLISFFVSLMFFVPFFGLLVAPVFGGLAFSHFALGQMKLGGARELG